MEYIDTRNHKIHGYKIIQDIIEYMDTKNYGMHGYKKSWNT